MTSSALTRREREVARLVAEGLTNREIAERLFISERTAEYHVEQIRNKLGFRSRAQIAAWITEQGADGQRVPAEPVIRPAQRGRGKAGRRLWVAALLLTLVASGVVALITRPWSGTSASGPTIKTVAGSGSVDPNFPGGHTGDGGAADHAYLSRPTDVVASRDGTIYVADCGNNVVRRIARDGIITTWAGGGAAPPTDGAFATTVSLGFASNLAVDTQGHPYVLLNRTGALEVWMIQPNERMAFVTSLGPSTGPQPTCLYGNQPLGGLAIADDGTLYVADRAENRVWRVAPKSKPTMYAGTGKAGYSGDKGAATTAMLDQPIGLALDRHGDLYIVDSQNSCIRKVDGHGVISTVAGSCGSSGDGGDGGPAIQARLNLPFGVAVGKDDAVFIADTGNNRVREITPSGTIVALAGTYAGGFKGDGGPAAQAELSGPEAVTLDGNGDLLVADTENHRVRELMRVSR